MTLRKLHSRLQGHPHVGSLPGIETTSGPLGQGLSQAIGMVHAARLRGEEWRTVAIMSDGEQQEGQIWEAVLYAGAHKVPVIGVLDRNYIQIDGPTEDVLPMDSLADKYRSFRWEVREINGNDFEEIHDAFTWAWSITDRPVLILAHTTPGKGVGFMEHDYQWHGKPPTSEQAGEALQQLWKEVA